MNTETVLGWHFLTDDSRRTQDRRRVEPGAVETCPNGKLVVCHWGLHACERPLDALRYAQGALIRRVELSGEIVRGEGLHADKLVARVRRELWRADATTLLHEFACWCAEQALTRERTAGREPDPRSWAAIETKRRWLSGEATDEELAAANSAANSAAWGAAWGAAWDAAWGATRDAAWGAANSAAWSAAWGAAWDAAWGATRDATRGAAKAAAWSAAWGAAWGAAWDAQNAELEQRLLALPEAQEARP